MKRFTQIISLGLLLLLTGCSSAKPEPTASVTQQPAERKVKSHQIGMATYYANKFHGRKTASGERLDNKKLTAAHPTLPFGTQVRVTALRNNQSVIVKINDRGPFTKGYIIDITRSAADELDLVREGVGKVKVEVLE